MLRTSSSSLLRHAVIRRSLASIDTGAVTPKISRSHPLRRFLIRTSLAISLFYGGGLALAEYNDSFNDLFVENIPFAETLVDSFESYRDATTSSHPLNLDELRAKFGGVLGGKVSSVPNQGVKAQDAKKEDLDAPIVTEIVDRYPAASTLSARENAVLVNLSPINVLTDSQTPAKLAELVKRINETIKVINDQKLAVAEEQLSAIVGAHQALATSVVGFNKDLESVIAEGVSEKTAHLVSELTNKYEDRLKEEEAKLTDKFTKELQDYRMGLDERTAKQLAEDLKTNEQTLLAKHANEVALLSITQVEEFNKILKEKLDSERDGRLAHLKELDSGVGRLLGSVDKLNHILMKKEAVTQLTLTIEELKTKLQSSDSRPLNIQPQLKKLKSLSDIIPGKAKPCCKSKNPSPALLDVAISELETLSAKQKILTNEQLYNRWNLLADDFKTASLLSPNAGILGHTFAKMFSALLFTKEGSSPSNQDLDSVFARVNENLRLSKLDKAVEEVVGLQGWSYVLCKEWINDARRKLEIESLVDVLDCELRTF